jgi:beta-glucuronidase
VILGDFAGAYCHDSGATWEEGTDYTDAEQRKRIKDAIRERVKQVRNEPWLLAYILGNENNMPSSLFVNATRTNANKYPEEYARFLEELAVMIHELDPHHPVGVGNLMTGLVEYYRDYAPSLDFIGVNCYIGPDGFGSTFEKVKQTMDRPVLITEYGCDSYYTARGPDEEGQAEYHMGNWRDIDYNRAGGLGAGNSIGGCLFEWVDEWWKDNKMKKVDGEWVYKDPLDHQNTAPTGDMAFPDGKTQEEWLGITSQGRGCASPFLRVPKKAFYAYKKVWNSECRRKEMVPAE